MLLNKGTPTITEFENTLKEVLQRPSYRHLGYNVNGMLERLKEAIKQWIDKRLNTIFDSNPQISPSNPEQLSNLFMIVGLCLIFGIIIVLVMRVNKTLDNNTRLQEILGEKIDEGTTPSSLRKKAQGYESEGNCRFAIRFDFIALLLLMHNSNIMFLDEAKTNEEIYKSLINRKFPKAKEFKDLVDIFNSTWYGHKGGQKAEYLLWKKTIEELWKEVLEHAEEAK